MKPAVLLLAHGTPESPENVPEYMRNITGGRQVPEAVLQEVAHRYALIGKSPLTEITLAQARALQEEISLPVYVGMRNWHPYIAAAVRQMAADGVTHAVAICLAPQNSRTSVGLYRKAVQEAVIAAGAQGMLLQFVESWHAHPALIAAFAEKLVETLPRGDAASDLPCVVFTAHSVPCRTIMSTAGVNSAAETSGTSPDAYSRQAKQTAELVAARAGVSCERWHFAFQSQGMLGGPWLGPTVEDTLKALASTGEREVIIHPIGFVCDHVEVLYDIDIAFAALGKELGIAVRRPASLNVAEGLITALASLARDQFTELAAAPDR